MSPVLLLALGCQSDDPPPPVDRTEPTGTETCRTDEDFFAADAVPVLTECAGCHVEGGPAGGTRLVLVPMEEPAGRDTAWSRLSDFVTGTEDGAGLLIAKPTLQVSHGGGRRFDLLDPAVAVLTELVGRLQEPGGCEAPGELPMTCDGTVRPGSAPLRLLTDVQYRRMVSSVLGVEVPEGLFPTSDRGDGFRTWATANAISAAGAESVMLAAEAAAAALVLPEAMACAEGEAEGDCARRYLREKGALAFRRPLAPAEEALLTGFLDAGLPVEDAVRRGVEVMLQSPQALYLDPRGSTGGRPGSGPVALDPDALAARLAFLYTDAPPDEALRAAAAAGELSTPEGVAAQARRLVAGPAMVDVFARFHQDWLRLDQLDAANRDPAVYPQWDDALAASLQTEADLFVTEVVWLGQGTYDSLFFSDETWVDARVAPIYGVPAPEAGWARVRLDPATRPGLLTRAGWLAAHAHTTTSAPVRRGAFLLEQLLCESLDPPPGVNTTLPEPTGEVDTVREQLEAHWTDPGCAACHVRIDPVGFAFEHYGALGEWRDTWEDGIPVDATGTLDDPAGSFDGAAEVLDLVARSDRARACYAQRWFEYAVGRATEPEDACSIRSLSERFGASGGDLRGLMVDLSLTDAMRYRQEVEP